MHAPRFTIQPSLILSLVCTFLCLFPVSTLAAGPDLSVTKTCAPNGSQAALCTITITNSGDVASVAPISLTDTISGNASVNLSGVGGNLPATCSPGAQLINDIPLNCPSINTSLAPAASGTLQIQYNMPQGGTFTNCVSVTQAQNAGTPGDPNAANNTNICTTFSVDAPAPTTGSITIVKDAQPNAAQDFTFTSNQASIAPFPLDDDSDSTLSNQQVFTGLPGGSYTFTESQISGWTLSSVVCTPSSGTTTSTSTGVASINLTAGANVTCTFTNVQDSVPTGSICGVKFNDIDGDGAQDAEDLGLANWQISLGIATVPPVMTGTKGEYCFNDLPPGQYTISETFQSPWLQTFPGGSGTHTETLQAGQQLNGINFGNTFPAGACSPLSGSQYSLLTNGGFENAQLVTANHSNFFDQTLVPAWSTSESDGLIEVWGSNFGGVPAYSGNQFVELNAHTGATVYQTFTATPGSTVNISFAHRGRAGFPNQLTLSIGPVGGLPVTLGVYTAVTTAWTLNTVSYTFPLNGLTAYEIGFTSNDSTAGGNFLDAIDLIDVACLTGTVDDGMPLTDIHVFEFLEDNYPFLFKGRPIAGVTGIYNYRFYKESKNYVGVDDTGMIYVLGPFTNNEISFFGSVDALRKAILAWDAGPLPNALVFAFAEANFPGLFRGIVTAGKLQQYNYRFYADSGNYLAIDNAGMIYIFGPNTGNVIKGVGPVEALRGTIRNWQASLPK